MDKQAAILLHIESATRVCSVAVSRGDQYVHHLTELETMDHARIITLLIGQLLKEAGMGLNQLDAISLSEGPGSYTSLRVGMSAAKGICYGRDIPLIAINTLGALAGAAEKEVPDADYIIPLIDARRMEAYASVYGKGQGMLVDNQPLILDEDTFGEYLSNGKSIVFCGNGSEKIKPLYQRENVRFSIPDTDARYLIEPAAERFIDGDFTDLAYFSPNYIKSPNITKAKKKLL